MAKQLKTLQDYLDFFTKDFEPDPDPKEVWISYKGTSTKTLQEYRIPLSENLRVWHPYVVFIIFVYLKKFPFGGRWEKVAWEIPIKYKGTPFILTHRKFGFQIISSTESEAIKKLGIEAMTNIHKATKFAEGLIEPHIKSLVKKGSVTLDNEYSSIRNRYTFFREHAVKEFKSIERTRKSVKLTLDKGLKEAIKSHNASLKRVNAGNYYMTGMLDAYFSLLEHILVLLLPFLKHIKLSDIDLENFIGENWKSKYKVVFPLTKDKQALQLLEKLEKIKEDFRNPLTHGYFQKNGHSFYVHMDYLGAIPMTLTKSNQKFKYHFGGLGQVTFKEICACFDECDKFFAKSGYTKFGMRYIQSSLSIAFDDSSSKMYQAAMTSMKYFEQFIDHKAHEHDNAANMDW